MPNTRRYLVSSVGAPSVEGKKADVGALVPERAVVRSLTSGHCVVELSEAEVVELLGKQPSLLVEEDQDLERLMPMPGLGFCIDEGTARRLEFQVLAEELQTPIGDVTIFANGLQATYKARTGADGIASVRAFETSLERVVVSPRANYWSKVVPPPASGEKTTVTLSPLKAAGPQAWHLELLGVKPGEMTASGSGVKVAVIDGGIAEHADLVVKGGLNCLDGHDSSKFRVDEDGHGTHCAGIIAGRSKGEGITGVAPDAELYSLRVFPGGKLSDLIEAIQWAIDNSMDVVNLSLAITQPSVALEEMIVSALHRGIVCVSASGNDGGPVRYPAAIGGVIAVTAIGNLNSFPEDSAHALRLSELTNSKTGLFFANFSNLGPEVGFCAPGVAVVSSVPHGIAAWDGTSMAAPLIAGLAALSLSAYPQLKTRDLRQAVAVREMLAASSQDLELPAELQGRGLPSAAGLLACAALRQAAAKRLGAEREEQSRQLAQVGGELAGTRKRIEELLASFK
jgi:subtilisin family serine protease